MDELHTQEGVAVSRTKRTPKQRARREQTLAARIAAALGAIADRVAPEEKDNRSRIERSSWTKNWGNYLTDSKKSQRFRNRVRMGFMRMRPAGRFTRRSRRLPKRYGKQRRK